MPVLRIQERTNQSDNSAATQDKPESFAATLSFEPGGEFPLAIRDPFTTREEEDRLAWYFEEHLRFPFTKQVQASEAAASLRRYREMLFGQVFADHNAYATYKALLQTDSRSLQVEIRGTPAFHALHWEALADPDLPQPLALLVPMIRRHTEPQPLVAQAASTPTINLLIVSARPNGRYDMGYRTISRPLVAALRQANVQVNIDHVRPGTYQALDQHLRAVTAQHGAGFYQVIHFDVHGALLTYKQLEQGEKRERYFCQARYGRADLAPYKGHKAFLFLEDAAKEAADPLEASELANLLLQHQIPIAILNACQSGKQVGVSETSLGSQLMQAGVQLVLAMAYSVTVSAAEIVMRALYEQLFAGQDLATAIRQARVELANQKGRRAYFNQVIDLEDWVLPVVYQHEPIRLATRSFTPDEAKVHYERQAQRYSPPEPTYGFVGRDLDILQIEKRLLTKKNLLLVEGMGGAGKTTLLRHLGGWWQQTNLVSQVFYFGYDDHAWARQQVLDTIARQLLSAVEYYGTFQPMGLDAQQAYLGQKLRAERHLLILDNLESITGAELAIQHTLPAEEQEALQRLLAELAGGRTLVLLGSREREDWLAKDTFGENVYALAGLDPEAASVLAERILKEQQETGQITQQQLTQYRKDARFRDLLKLLDGFPLALEVVLSTLGRQSPAEVLAALREGQINLVDTSSQERTRSIVACVDYAHRQLPPEVQQLLLCLAPFTSVMYLEFLEQYTQELREQPALAALPYARWDELLETTAHWGLVRPDEVPGFLRLHPVLPFFLRSRLAAPEQQEVRQAIETAFRQHYAGIAEALDDLLQSKDPRERQLGQVLVQQEYENVQHALDLALAAQQSIVAYYRALSNYLDTRQDQQRGLELAQQVKARFEEYPPEAFRGTLGRELVGVLDDLAKRQLALKHYDEAEASYQEALARWHANQSFSESERHQGSASILHQLGVVAQEQRQWVQAEQYYQQALQIWIEFNDRYEQAGTLHQLGCVAQEQHQWPQARAAFLQALEIYVANQDNHNGQIVMNSLARLWQASQDSSLPAPVASLFGVQPEEVEAAWQRWLEEDSEPSGEEAPEAAAPLPSPAEDEQAPPERPAQPLDHPKPAPSDASQPSEAEMQAAAEALGSFLDADSWEETRAVLERKQEPLLSTLADQMLAALIAQAAQQHNQKYADYLALHRTLLRRARELGIPTAWAEFEAARQAAEQAPQAQQDGIAFTRAEAERAAQDIAFLAEKLGLPPDSPQLPALQQQLQQQLAQE